MRESIKNLTPGPLWQAGRAAWLGMKFGLAWPAAYLHPWRRDSMQRLAELKDAHRGQRAFILGNGPSLRRTDVSLLANEHTFGLNRVYLAFPQWGFQTSYFVSVNDLVIEQSAAEISQLPMPKFLAWRARRYIAPVADVVYLHSTYDGAKFAKDAKGRLWEGATVTYVALQLAYHMGFDRVVLIGVDHSFVSKGEPNSSVTSQGDDDDHFDPAYFGRGFRWQLPDLETSERAFEMARQAYERDGRQVLDATIDGKLNVFPKVDYRTLF